MYRKIKATVKDCPDASVTIDSQGIVNNSVALESVSSYEDDLLSSYINNMERRNNWLISTGTITIAVAFIIAVILSVVYSFC